ncbi:hypothetical protein P4V47_22385 [Brevibacillus laterosporus]|nr:hypothetical protein [Brevibacillus laterosporus]
MTATLQANVMVETDSLTHNEWLNYRRNGIGGSDLAAICNLSKLETAHSCVSRKNW